MKTCKGIVDAWPARSNVAHNPFQYLLSDAMQELGWTVREFSPVRTLFKRADVWHWHWPDGQFSHRSRLGAWLRFAALLVLIGKARLSGTPVVWTAHNIKGHESENRTVEDRFWPIFHRHVSAVHYLSDSSRAVAEARYPILATKPFVVTHHGHYRDVYGAPLAREEARAILGLEVARPTVVFCGKISAYKGVTDLMEVFSDASRLDAQLLVAGKASEAEELAVRRAAAMDSRILLKLKLLSDAEIKAAISSADLVVLPYRDVTNSGSALLALSLDRPVLASKRGSLLELETELGSRWVRTFDELNPKVLSEALQGPRPHDGETADLDFCSWERIGMQLDELYVRVQKESPLAGDSAPL